MVLIGNRRYPRYAVTFNRSPSSLYWTGVVEDPWTTEISEAMRWADYGRVTDAIGEIKTTESDDSPGDR